MGLSFDLTTLEGQRDAITAIYVGYFNRAPEPEGLEYWIGRLQEFLDGAEDGDAGLSLAQIANSFSVQPETTSIYSFFTTPSLTGAEGFITQVYLNLFNRTPDADGLDYWTGQLIAAPASNDDDKLTNKFSLSFCTKIAFFLVFLS